MAARRKLIAGNWKMNCLRAEGLALVGELSRRLESVNAPAFDMLVCPPATLVAPVADVLKGGKLDVGGQDCHAKEKGAHTGDVSAPMLKELGCTAVIVGHSERRQDHGETDAVVKAKATAVHVASMTAIICVGETEAERDAGRAEEVVAGQLRGSIPLGSSATNTVIAYEPVWAIGTGRTPTNDDIAAMHAMIRRTLDGLVAHPESVRILYGGSVKPSNAAEIMALEDVDGALVGGASLKADDFWAIAESCR